MRESRDPGLRLFGSFAYDHHPGPLSGPGKRLLCRLVLGENRSYGRGELADILWPGAEAERGRFYLRRALTQLRPALRPSLQIEAPRDHLRLVADPQEVDVLMFDRLVQGDEEAALERAIHLYRAPLLVDWPDDWISTERESRRLAWHSAIEKLAEADLRRDRPANAARRLGLSVAADPLREASHRLLIAALRRAGDPAQADRQYEGFERRMRRELGLSPSPETRRALRDPVVQTGLTVAAPAGLRLVPVVASALIGRASQLEDALKALKTSRLVTLVGPGGVGKTRLSLGCAEALDPASLDLVALVDLASREEGQALGPFLARSVRAPLVPRLDPMECVVRHLEDRRGLLLLDNCEHMIEAAGGAAQLILDRCPFVSILATSRQALGLPDETILDVPSLDLAASEALFRDAAVRKGRPVPESEAASVAVRRVCGAVDRLPLGIVLAAASLRTTPLEALADDLYGVLGADVGSKPRHRSLRAAVEWSYRFLSPREAALLRGVSPIQGHWTADLAQASIGTNESVDDALRSLVAKSLIEIDEDEIGPRYRILEPIREDALRRLRDAGEETSVQQRLRAWALARSEEVYRRFRGHPLRSERPTAEREIAAFESVLLDCLRTPEGRRRPRHGRPRPARGLARPLRPHRQPRGRALARPGPGRQRRSDGQR